MMYGDVQGPDGQVDVSRPPQQQRTPSCSCRAGECPTFLEYFNGRYAWSDALIDCLTIAGMGTRFARGRHSMSQQEILLFTLYISAVLLHMLWRWWQPRSYYRWRHVTGTAFTLCATCTPWFWRRRLLGLARPRSPAGPSVLQSAVAAARVVLVSSYTLQLTVYALGRPAPLWLKLATHTVSVAVAVSHASGMCATPVFTQPAVAHWLGSTYRAFRTLSSLLPLPLSALLPDPSEAAACTAVVTWVHISLGYALPLLFVAGAEARARQQHAQHRMYRPVWRRQKRKLWWRLATWLSTGPHFLRSYAVDVVAACVVAAALWDVVVAVLAEGAVDPGAAAGLLRDRTYETAAGAEL